MSAAGEVRNQDREGASVRLLALSKDPFQAPTDRDMLPSERRLLLGQDPSRLAVDHDLGAERRRSGECRLGCARYGCSVRGSG